MVYAESGWGMGVWVGGVVASGVFVRVADGIKVAVAGGVGDFSGKFGVEEGDRAVIIGVGGRKNGVAELMGVGEMGMAGFWQATSKIISHMSMARQRRRRLDLGNAGI
jgi:hypothetical protein